MAIRRGHENVAAQFGLAELAGIAEAREAKDQQAFQLARDFQQKQDRMELAMFNEELKKNSMAQQMQWEYEKLMISQRNQFELEEQVSAMNALRDEEKRQRQQDQRDAVLKSIEEDDTLSDYEKSRARLMVKGVPPSAFGKPNPTMGMRQQAEQQEKAAKLEAAKQPPTPEEFVQAAEMGMVVVKEKATGVHRVVSLDENTAEGQWARHQIKVGDLETVTVPPEAMVQPEEPKSKSALRFLNPVTTGRELVGVAGKMTPKGTKKVNPFLSKELRENPFLRKQFENQFFD